MFLDKRDSCVTCPTETPKCNCKSGETCTLTSQTCSSCPTIICTPGSSSGSSAGPIAGGVVGGLVGLALIIGLFFWFRRRRGGAVYEPEDSFVSEEKPPSVENRATHYSIDSVNTTQARGSNVIPIAYIPGVTGLSDAEAHTRGSVATSDYRASLPDFVMAVHGQPSIVEISNLNNNNRNVPGQPGIAGQHQQLANAPIARNQVSSLYGDLGLEEFGVPYAGDVPEIGNTNGTSMVTIPEETDEESMISQRMPVGTQRYRVLDGSLRRSERTSNYSEQHSAYTARHSTAGQDRFSKVSRTSSVGEYNMNLPEEAYLYYNNLKE